MALKFLLGTKSPNQNFRPPPLKVSLLKIIDSPKVILWDFAQSTVRAAATKLNKVAVFTDGQTCSKVTIFQQSGNKIIEGNTYKIKGHTIRGNDPPYFQNFMKRTKFFRTTDMSVTQKLC